MSVSALGPTAPTTLVIVLGASAWPNSPGFQASRAFMHAAQGFRDYLLDPRRFGLLAANLLDLFDASSSASDQLEQLESFLEQRTHALKAANQAVRDVLVYFVGHGSFAGPSADFCLMIHRTNSSSLKASGIAIEALAEVLLEKARHTRRYLFLDCCYSAAAFKAFQGAPDQVATTKTLDVLYVRARGSGFPRKGTVLLCSSDHKTPSLLLPDESCTMFSYALLDALGNGDPHRPHHLSVRDIRDLALDRLAALPDRNAPRPGLHSPDQSEGDVADVPFFPNFSFPPSSLPPFQRPANKKSPPSSIPITPPPVPSSPLSAQHPAHPALTGSSPAQQIQTSVPIPSRSPAVPSSVQPKLRYVRSLSVVIVVLILLSLLLFRVYGTTTGQQPSNPSHEQATSTSPGKSVQDTPSSPTMTSVPTITPVSAPTSVLGQTWHTQDSGGSHPLHGVAWSGSQFVVVGDTGTILTSPDGSTWTPQHSDVSVNLHGVAWSDSQFVVVGDTGTILTSPDGSAWTAQKSGTSTDLHGVAGSASLFVAVGSGGTILTSPDGSTWIARSSGTTQNLDGVTWSCSQFVAVGSGGTILTSP